MIHNKTFIQKIYQLTMPVLIPVFLVFLSSCEEKPSFVGLDILPEGDKLKVNLTDTVELTAYTEQNDSLEINDMLPPEFYYLDKGVLGYMNDPVFGITKSAILLRINIGSAGKDFGENPKLDSLILQFKLDGYDGNGESEQQFTVYEFTDTLSMNPGIRYYNTFNMEGKYNTTPLQTVNARVENSILHFNLTSSLGNKLMNPPSQDSVYKDATNFSTYFSGFYIVPTHTTPNEGEGGVAYINYRDAETSFKIYYENNEKDSLSSAYILSRRLNLADYITGARVEEALNKTEEQDSLLFLQSSRTKIKLSFPNLAQWENKTIGINSAELIFHVNHTDELYPYPDQLFLGIIKDGEKLELPKSGSVLREINKSTLTYKFNIKQFFQYLLLEEPENPEFYLFINNEDENASRVIINGATHSNPVQFTVMYTIF